jgi:hypothetical protein
MSLEEFVTRIREIETLYFGVNLYRGNFEKWVNEVLGDSELTKRIASGKLLQPTGNASRVLLNFFNTKLLKN